MRRAEEIPRGPQIEPLVSTAGVHDALCELGSYAAQKRDVARVDITPERAEAVDGPIGPYDGAPTARKGINPLEVAQIDLDPREGHVIPVHPCRALQGRLRVVFLRLPLRRHA